MLTAIIRYLSGYLLIRIEGYSPERFLNLCRHHRIYLWNLRPLGHAYEMNISVRGFRRLKPILRKTRTRIYIKERRGFPFFFTQIPKTKNILLRDLVLYGKYLHTFIVRVEYPY